MLLLPINNMTIEATTLINKVTITHSRALIQTWVLKIKSFSSMSNSRRQWPCWPIQNCIGRMRLVILTWMHSNKIWWGSWSFRESSKRIIPNSLISSSNNWMKWFHKVVWWNQGMAIHLGTLEAKTPKIRQIRDKWPTTKTIKPWCKLVMSSTTC